jgi:hypothetical protein
MGGRPNGLEGFLSVSNQLAGSQKPATESLCCCSALQRRVQAWVAGWPTRGFTLTVKSAASDEVANRRSRPPIMKGFGLTLGDLEEVID